GGLIEHATARLRRSVRTIAADVSSPRANLLNFRNVDLLCPTERELRSNLNDYDRGLSAAAHTLLAKTQARHLFVTLQKKGLVVFDRPSQDPESPQWSARLLSEHLPSFVDRPIDCLGGGDALLATASLALASGSGLLPAAYLGNAAAAFEIARLGNVPLDAPALRRWVHHQTHLADAPPEPALSPAGDHAGVC
ncbi:MAG: PfkB family carbohydrate kinase, partial [Phycisphaerae bacterium]